jgi:peptide-methionine (S)-S-oxide reductase
MKNLVVILSVLFSVNACGQDKRHTTSNVRNLSKYQTAYFASGCFWCVEAVFESVEGVIEAESGYAGGEMKNPTYALVSAGKTKHAEAVKVYYDSSVVSFETLVDVFFNSHDPSTLNQQGPDRGTQYRSIAFYSTEAEKKVIIDKVNYLLENKVYSKVTTEVIPFRAFYRAEDYHQNYEKRYPNDSYVRAVSIPRLNAFKRKMPDVLKK